MAEKIISPGVFTNEIDQTFLPAAVTDIGAAIVGPTIKGPALVPTVVTSYAEFVEMFGDSFKSGSTSAGNYQTYLTSLSAQNYLQNSNTLTVVRILDGTYGTAHSFCPTGSNAFRVSTDVSASMSSAGLNHYSGSSTATNWTPDASSIKLYTLADGAIMNNGPVAVTSGYDGGITGSSIAYSDSEGKLATIDQTYGGGYPGGDASYIMNSSTGSAGGGGLGKDGIIAISGSKHNLRWEISNINKNRGTFTLLVRRGDDSYKRKQILETWNNLSLDPNSNNYAEKIIGDSYREISGTETEPYINYVGQYPNKSKYIRVEVLKTTPDYLDENGDVRDTSATGSLPGPNSGSFVGGLNGFAGFDSLGNAHGSNVVLYDWYERIGTNSQGFNPGTDDEGKTAYNKALNLLANQDEYDINLLLLPGIISNNHSAVATKAIDVCEDRGDCFVLLDPVVHGSALTTATTQAKTRNSSYAAMYWPWIQVPEPQLGKNVWVPPSVSVAGMYAFNDKVGHPWLAPAGLNRGTLNLATQAERKLTQGNRDDLYDSNVNPIATFPAQGVVVFGQKTLQKKSTALDRINVRRLLIRVKKFIASSSRFLVFEQNTSATRRRFLNIAEPFLNQVQAQSGVSAFRVVMDETNNTPDVVDRNILIGQIFIQPTRTAEFITLDFTVQPTGATFPE